MLACTSAAGYALPPYIVFDRRMLNKEFTKGEVPGSAYRLSVRGWMDRDWLLNYFLHYVPSSRPMLLLADGHSSHYCPEMIKASVAEGVIIFALPPHTTYLSQPLDKVCLLPLKWSGEKLYKNLLPKIKKEKFHDTILLPCLQKVGSDQ